MAQHDYIISNQTFPNTRADINNLASAIATNNSGTSAPTTQYAGQFWIDTTSSTWTLYIHDGSDDIQFATIDTSANTVNFIDSALDVVTDTTPQLGGDLDLNSNDITGTGNINITGTATVSGDLTVDTNTLYVDSANNLVGIGTTSPSSFNQYADNLVVGTTSGDNGITIASGTGNSGRFVFSDNTTSSASAFVGAIEYSHTNDAMIFYTSASERMRIDSSGNVLVGKTSDAFADEGVVLATTQSNAFTRDDANVMAVRRNTSDGDIIQIRKDSTFAGSIGTFSGEFYVGGRQASRTGLIFGINEITPTQNDGTVADNIRNLGSSTARWKDVYVGSNIYLGGTGSANALDDYEEGTFTPVLQGSASNPTVTYTHQLGKYTKVGNQVTVNWYVETTAFSGGSGDLRLGGLPFANNSINTLFGTGAITGYKVDMYIHSVARIFASGSYASIFGRDTLTTSGTWATKSVSAWLSSGVCALGFTLTYLTD